jgi:hypothetical protein
MSRRSASIRAWCARVWQCVLQTTQTLAGCDLTGQCTGGWPPQHPAISLEQVHQAMIAVPEVGWTLDPAAWAHCTRWALEPPAATTEVAQHVATGRPPALTTAEQVRLRDRYWANRTPFTSREMEQLQFVRWLHHTGRSSG